MILHIYAIKREGEIRIVREQLTSWSELVN